MTLPIDVTLLDVRPGSFTVPDAANSTAQGTKSPTSVIDGETTATPSPSPFVPVARSSAPSCPFSKADEVPKLEMQLSSRFQLEDLTPFARCHLWKLMMSFYERQGVKSWAQGIVPHFITSNTFIAKRYSNMLRAYIRDAINPGSVSPMDMMQPFYIVELGAGSGKFSFYFLMALAQMESVLDFPLNNIRYIMTDFTEQNLNFWKTHPALAPFVKRGIVDFANFDATIDSELHLYSSGQIIRPGELSNPVCLIANYLFDTLHHDLFQVDGGVLKEGLISVGSKRAEESDPLDPEIIKRLHNIFEYNQIDETYYGETNPHYNNILKWYHDYFDPASSGATILVPIGALSAIDRLSALSKNGLVILSGDKGNNNPDYFRGVSDPHIAVHGSFSVMVNYHAIGVYFASRGGFALHSPQEEVSLKVSAFVLPANAAGKDEAASSIMMKLYGRGLAKTCAKRSLQFPHLSIAFKDDIVSFGPNDFFVMQKAMKEDAKAPSLKAVLALMHLSGWDPDVFYKFRDVLLGQLPTASAKLKLDVMYGIPLVWKNYYALDKEKDVAFEIGRLYYGMNEYDSALAYYTISVQEMGKHHVTSHNMGLCHYSKKQLQLAATYFEEAVALDRSYQKAAVWLQRVRKELSVVRIGSVSAVPSYTTVQQLAESESNIDHRQIQRSPGSLVTQQCSLTMPNHEDEKTHLSSAPCEMAGVIQNGIGNI